MKVLPINPLLEVPPDAVEKIRKIYNLDKEERLQETLDLLEDWMQKQTHFVKRDFPRSFLEKSLISCKGSVEKTKKQLDKLCTVKTVLPKFFTKTNVKEELNTITKFAWLLPLPKLTDDFYRVLFLHANDTHCLPQHLMEFYQYIMILGEYVKKYDYVNGFVIVIDLRNVNIIDLVTKMNVVELQQCMTIVTEAYGARVRNIYLISESKTIEVPVKIAKQFLSKKISGRIHVLANLIDLKENIPQRILPKDYGGDENTYEMLYSEFLEALSSSEHVQYMRMMSRACTDESRRPAVQFNQDYMGMPGSFRNLSVD